MWENCNHKVKMCDDIFKYSDTVHQWNRQTDRRTDRQTECSVKQKTTAQLALNYHLPNVAFIRALWPIFGQLNKRSTGRHAALPAGNNKCEIICQCVHSLWSVWYTVCCLRQFAVYETDKNSCTQPHIRLTGTLHHYTDIQTCLYGVVNAGPS